MTPFFPNLAEAVERTLRSEGLSMLLMNAENDPDWEQNCIYELISRRVDGLLISETHGRRAAKQLRRLPKSSRSYKSTALLPQASTGSSPTQRRPYSCV